MLVHESRALAMNLALDLGLLAAILPPACRDEGSLSGQARTARGRPVGPHPAGATPLARTPELSAGVRRAGARRGQARDPLESSRTNQLPQPRPGRQRGSPIGCAGFSGSRIPSGSESPGWWRFISTWERPRSCANRSSSASWPSRESRSCWRLHRADALASTGDTEHVDYCEYLPEKPARRPDQPTAAAHRP